MGEPATDLDEIQLLTLIGAGRVADNDAAFPLVYLDGQHIPMAEPVWALYRRGLVHQLEGKPGWLLTWRGRDVLQGRTNG